jgi:hypothetical protein
MLWMPSLHKRASPLWFGGINYLEDSNGPDYALHNKVITGSDSNKEVVLKPLWLLKFFSIRLEGPVAAKNQWCMELVENS